MIGDPGFNPASPGPIGGTTPAAITGTTITGATIVATTAVLLPEENDTPRLRGSTSTGAGIATKFDRTYVFGGAQQVIEVQSTQVIFYKTITAQAMFVGVSGVAFAPSVGGAIFDHFTDGASVSTDGTEDTLYTDTLAAGALGANGAKLRGYYQVAIVGHAVSTDRIRLYFGGTAIFDTTAVNWPLNAQATIRFEIIRVSSTVVRAAVSVTTTTATVIPYSVYTEITALTLSDAQVIALKDISTGTNSAPGDVTAKLGSIWWHPAA